MAGGRTSSEPVDRSGSTHRRRAVVRRAVVKWMDGHPRLDDVLLAITELVNNAVMHGGLGPGDSLKVTVGPDGNLTRLAVGHAGVLFDLDELPPSSREPGASRGLAIVI